MVWEREETVVIIAMISSYNAEKEEEIPSGVSFSFNKKNKK